MGNIDEFLSNIFQAWGVNGVGYGGCVRGNRFRSGPGAMRRRGHAHSERDDPLAGWICIKAFNPSRRYTSTGKPSMLVWHEVAHIWRRSWTEKQCDAFAWKMVRKEG